MNFFEKAINGLKSHKGVSVVPETALTPAPNTEARQTKPDIVTKYILVNPKCAFVNYDLFSLCISIFFFISI